jgi:V/A-type H+-transporting ATPase subunit I
MIVPMKKVAVIFQSKDACNALLKLRSAGVLHVTHQRPPAGGDITSLQSDISFLDKAISILSSVESSAAPALKNVKFLDDWRVAARHISALHSRIEQLDEYSKALSKKIAELSPWGDFDPEALKSLAAKGVWIRLYALPEKGAVALKETGAIIKVISLSKGTAYCAVISRAPTDIGYKEFAPSGMGLAATRERLEHNARAATAIREELSRYVVYKKRFEEIKKAYSAELAFHEVLGGMGDYGALSCVAGYMPSDQEKDLSSLAGRERWALMVNEPSEEDNVPVLLRNPRWVSTIKPVFKLMEVVPGYREFDISPLLLIFLGLFFGMIIGDAGYGTLYILLTLLAERKFGKGMKERTVFRLLYFFSGCAIFWGMLTGTVFGQEWYAAAGFKPAIPILNNTHFIQAFCFFLGAFHLTLAHLWQALRKAPSVAALADAGWVMVLWSAYFFAKMLILSAPLPGFVMPLLSAGLVLIIFCTAPQKNILKTMASGLGTVALSIMNNFTDVVSYIRLFAVGLAGVAIADTVNTLAATFGGKSILLKAFILFHGHLINLMLGPISVLVHGLRLNVLEFSSHIGLTWSGTPYRPLESPER